MSTVKFNTWQNTDGTENYKCRAWVNFDGTGTPSIRGDGNVSSITDNGTGDYWVNFSSSMPDTNYSAAFSTQNMNSDNGVFDVGMGVYRQTPYTDAVQTSRIRVTTVYLEGYGRQDYNWNNVQIFR